MADRIDLEGRASFVQTLPRKVTELRATLGTLVADPRSQRMRDELRRRLHALYTLTRSYNLPTLSEGLREGIAHLDAVRGTNVLTQRDLETLADLIATLPALARKDLPDQPELFVRPRDVSGSATSSSQPGGGVTLPALPPEATARSGTLPGVPAQQPGGGGAGPGVQPAPSVPREIPPERNTVIGMPAVRPPEPAHLDAASAPREERAPATSSPSAPPPRPAIPLGVLVVGSAGVAQDVKRVLPPEADVTAVRTLSDAVTAARDTAPDVIVTESAPPADGLGLLAALRGDPLTDFLPVVLLAAPGDGVDAETARAQGATDLLPLPIDPDRLREAIERAAQVLTQPSIPAPAMGELTLEELTRTLQDEIRRGILAAAGPRASGARIALGSGSEVLAATWEAIARVREVVERRTRGRVRFEAPAAPLGLGGAHVMSLGDDATASDLGEGGDDPADDPLPGRRALVVDDDANVVWFFAGLLREAGMEVAECNDGFEALREARARPPDVIVSDILMPGLDGFALCRAIRRDVALRHTPVILLSWKEDLLVRMRELGAQAQGFLRKETRGEAILLRVRAVLRPRVRLLRRLEQLGEGAEVRGRVERVGVITLLETAARLLRDATVTVTDSYSVTQLELREGRLVSVVRTAQDGSFARGEGALLQVLGASSARFALRRSASAVRANVQGELSKLLAGGAALITALEDAVSGATLLEVGAIDLDRDTALSYARSMPKGVRALIERLAGGESPRALVLHEGVAPQELEPVLVELARRGAIRGVRGAHGEDMVAPRLSAAQGGEVLAAGSSPALRAVGPARTESGELPPVLRVPPATAPSEPARSEATAAEPPGAAGGTGAASGAGAAGEAPAREPGAASGASSSESSGAPSALAAGSAETRAVAAGPTKTSSGDSLASLIPLANEAAASGLRASGSGAAAPRRTTGTAWTPPTTIDEAARPGFGLDGGKDSLADAVLREITEPDEAGEVVVSPLPIPSLPRVPADVAGLPIERIDEPGALVSDRPPAPPPVPPAATQPEAQSTPTATTSAAAVEELTRVEPTGSTSTEPAATQSAAPIATTTSAPSTDESAATDATPAAVAADATREAPRVVIGGAAAEVAPDDAPEIAEEESEAGLSLDDLHKAAASAPGLPLEGVELDARGLPRKRAASDSPPRDPFAVGEPAATRREPEPPPSDSIIIDVAALGAPVEVIDTPRKKSGRRDSVRAAAAGGSTSGIDDTASDSRRTLLFALAVVALAAVGFFGMRLALDYLHQRESPGPGGALGVVPADTDAATAPVVVPGSDDAAAAPSVAETSDAAAAAPVPLSDDASPASTPATADAGFVYEDPAPYLDGGGALGADEGLLVLAPAARGAELEVTVNQRAVPHLPATLRLPAGVHTVRYRANNTVGFHFVPVQSGRAVRVELSPEP